MVIFAMDFKDPVDQALARILLLVISEIDSDIGIP